MNFNAVSGWTNVQRNKCLMYNWCSNDDLNFILKTATEFFLNYELLLPYGD